MTSISRRSFLHTLSLTTAGICLGARYVSAEQLRAGVTPAELFNDSVTPETLRALALSALDAAKSSGASYADVRVASRQLAGVIKQLGPTFRTDLENTFEFGVRVFVNGGWGFVHGVIATTDAVTEAARGAVTQARDNARVVKGPDEFIPAPVATGEWSTPFTIDPFGVPLQEQMAMLYGWSQLSNRTLGTGDSFNALRWNKETRVVATTVGTLVTQHLLRSDPAAGVGVSYMRGGRGVGLGLSSLFAMSAGYECVADPKLEDQLYATAQEAARLALLPAGVIDVGRYPVVFDGVSLGGTVYKTVGRALEMDRVLGEEADASGTSFLAPAPDHLGVQRFSPALTITADRALPSVTNVRWDDEGSTPVSSTLIRDGQIVDYQTSCTSSGELKPWYEKQGLPLGSRGCAVAPEAGDPVQVRCGHLTVEPAKSAASIDDLIRDIPHGILVRNDVGPQLDQQGTSGNVSYWGGLFFEVERGRIVRRLKDVAIQFNTRDLLGKSLVAVGDSSTMLHSNGIEFKGQPWRRSTYHATAPAALFKNVDVIQIGLRV